MWKTTLYETSKLTIELRDIVNNGDNSVDIWDFDYPSYYSGKEKTDFERKVIDHFYFRQIGQETVGRFLHMFRTKIREIMPFYVQMYKSVEIMNNIEDPFGNVDITETYQETRTGKQEGTTEGSTTGTSSSTATSSTETSGTDSKTGTESKVHKFSDTPQGNIANLDDGYLTEASKDDNNVTDRTESSGASSAESSGSGTTSETTEGNTTLDTTETIEHTFKKKGNQGVNTYAHDMIEFRQAIINVDMMIINDLNELFLGVY